MSMVACLKCKSVVWAYDHVTAPVAGLMNMMNMPCGNCGALRSFDGWNHEGLDWAEMHEIADREGLAWRADGNNEWFGDATLEVAEATRERWRQAMVQALLEEAADIHMKEEDR